MEFTSIDRETAKAIRIAEKKIGYTSNNVGISIPFTFSSGGLGVGRSFGCHNCMTNCCRNGEELELQPDCQTALHFFLKTLFCHCDVAQNIFMMDGCKYNRIHVARTT